MPENAAHGLDLLDPDHEVVVTGEEDHQDVLRAWAPHAGPRRVAVELRPAPLRRGGHAGQPGLEALLDGRRIGELTQLMSVRYRSRVDEVLRRGGRPGAVGLVRNGRRGLVEVELRLPDVTAAPAPPRPLPGPAPLPPSGARPPEPGAPGPARGRFRLPALVGGGVVALLIMISTVAGGSEDDDRVPAAAPAAPATTQGPTTTAPTPTTPRTTTPATTTPGTTIPPTTRAPVAEEDDTVVAAGAPATTRPARPVPTTTRAAPAVEPAPRPAPAPAPEPTPEPEPEEEPSGCDPNYSGCVPIASDVDCEGGSGNGPAYVSGPVRVTGTDVYGLDSNDGDGIGCE